MPHLSTAGKAGALFFFFSCPFALTVYSLCSYSLAGHPDLAEPTPLANRFGSKSSNKYVYKCDQGPLEFIGNRAATVTGIGYDYVGSFFRQIPDGSFKHYTIITIFLSICLTTKWYWY